jgi:phosphoglycolate phosphatase
VTNVPEQTLVCLGLIGTTVADDGVVERAYAEAIATQGIVTGTSAYARGMAQVHRGRGKAVIDVLQELFPGNEARAQAAHLAFDKSLSGSVERAGIRPVPGAVEALEELAGAGCRVCVISSLSHRQLDVFLAALDWQGRVDLALGADDAPRSCPWPDPVLQAMLQLGVGDVRETVVVQSTESGVLSGGRAGAGMVAGVLTGSHPAARLRQAGATHVLASIADVPAVLAGVGAASGRSAAGMTVPRPAPEAQTLAERPGVGGMAVPGGIQESVRRAGPAVP